MNGPGLQGSFAPPGHSVIQAPSRKLQCPLLGLVIKQGHHIQGPASKNREMAMHKVHVGSGFQNIKEKWRRKEKEEPKGGHMWRKKREKWLVSVVGGKIMGSN